jgi:hypothetical protein
MTTEEDITTKREALTSKLQDLRSQTMQYSHISRSRGIKIDDDKPLAKLNSEITATETKISQICAATAEINQHYEKFGISSLDQLNELGEIANEMIRSGPVKAWDALKLTRDEYDNMCSTFWLPSDLVREPEYEKVESEICAAMKIAKVAEASLRESRDKILMLVKEVEAIPV